MVEEAGNKVARGRGRPKVKSDEERRIAIVDCARRTFVDLGFAGTTTDIVAARCKISKNTLYRSFASKHDLLVAAIVGHRQLMLDLPRPPGEDLPVLEALERIFFLDIDEEQENERRAFVQFVIRETDRSPEIGGLLFMQGALPSRQNLSAWLAEQCDRGTIVLDDVPSGARMLMDMMFGGVRAPPGHETALAEQAQRRRHLQRCLEIFVRGRFAPIGPQRVGTGVSPR